MEVLQKTLQELVGKEPLLILHFMRPPTPPPPTNSVKENWQLAPSCVVHIIDSLGT